MSGSSDGHVKIFDSVNFTLLQSIKADSKDVSCLSLDSYEQYFAFADESNSVYIYSLKDLVRLKKVDMATYGSISAITFHKIETITFVFICIKESGVYFMEDSSFKKSGEGLEDLIELKPRKAYTAFEMYKEQNLLFAIDTECTLSVWDAKDFLPNKRKYLPMAKFEVSPAYNDFYLKYLNNIFIMLNRNGHGFFKCTDFRKLQLNKISEHKYRKINMTQRERSHTIGFNHLYTMIAVNVDRTNSNLNENCPFSCELMIYCDSDPNDIILKKSINEKYMGLEFNTNIFVISPNPKYDSIFVTGDSDGKIVIWDLATLQVLSVFKEYCTHIGQAAISNPILELSFVKSGNEFFVSTFYGCISFYSALDNHDNMFAEPDEQFFTSDFTQDQVSEYCNVELQPHKVCTSNDEKNITLFNITKLKKIMDKKSRMSTINNHNSIEYEDFFKDQKKEFENAHKLNDNELKERLKAFTKPEIIEKIVKPKNLTEEQNETSQKIIRESRLKPFVSARLNKNKTNVNQDNDESEYSDSSSEQIRKNRNKKNKQRRIHPVSESSSLSVTHPAITNGHVSRTNTYFDRTNFDQYQQITENHSRTQGDSKKSKKCSVCNADNAKFYCSSCNLLFDYFCQKKYLIDVSTHENNCYDCFFYKRIQVFNQNLGKQPIRSFLKNCNRENWNISSQFGADQLLEYIRYIPQIGESYYFIPEAFNAFIKQYYKIVDANQYVGSINSLLELHKDFLVEVIDWEYTFPWVNFKYEFSKLITNEKNDLHILLNLKLRVSSNNGELPMDTIINTSFTISNDLDTIFLIPKHIYDLAKQYNEKSSIGMSVEFRDKVYVVKSCKKGGNSLYGSVELTDLYRGVMARSQNKNSESGVIHPWILITQLEYNAVLRKREVLFDNKEYLEFLAKKMRTLKSRYALFIDEVDKEVYTEYLCFVEVEVNISLIQERLENNYYFSKAQLQKDIEQIEENAAKFNETNSDVCELAKELVKMLKDLLSKTNDITTRLDKHNMNSDDEQNEEEILLPPKRRKIF